MLRAHREVQMPNRRAFVRGVVAEAAEASMGHRWLHFLAILLFLPALAFAQEATVVGTVTDATGGVLPGVTVRAVHEATGNTFETITDERGNFRIPVRTGG